MKNATHHPNSSGATGPPVLGEFGLVVAGALTDAPGSDLAPNIGEQQLSELTGDGRYVDGYKVGHEQDPIPGAASSLGMVASMLG